MEDILSKYKTVKGGKVSEWCLAGLADDFPDNGGACVKIKDLQIAVFKFSRTKTWYACQNLCPHKMEMVLSRGMIGSEGSIPKVACPLHKRTFSLETGENLNSDLPPLTLYPVKIHDDKVFIGLG